MAPHSEDAERGVLGSALTDAERVIDLCISRKVTAASFFFQSHATLFEELHEMHRTSAVIDLLTVTNRLKERGHYDTLGGADFLEKLIDFVPTSAHAEFYIDIVHQHHIRRRIIQEAEKAIDKSQNPEIHAELILAESEQAFFDIIDSRQTNTIVWSEVVAKQVKEINRICDENRAISGVACGFYDIDRMLSGLQKTDMIILAARPSMGKTSLALNMAENIALGISDPDRIGRPVGVFSCEMSADQLVRRMLCCHARLPSSLLGGGRMSPENHRNLMHASKVLSELKIYIDDSAGLDVLELRSRARRMKKKYNIEFLVVDYLQLLHYDQKSDQGRQLEVAGISGELKGMAKELQIPVLVLSQLSRAPETRDRTAKPKLSDLRDSGSIEQDADVVLLLRRPCRYPDDPESSDKRLSIVDIAKHRNGGVGEIRLNFEDSYTRFENRKEDANVPDD